MYKSVYILCLNEQCDGHMIIVLRKIGFVIFSYNSLIFKLGLVFW